MTIAPRQSPTRQSPPRQRVVYGLMAMLAVVLLVTTGVVLWRGANGTAGGAMAIGGPFSLVDGTGKKVTDATFRGKYMLVYFGYTFCPDACPTTLNAVADAMDKLGSDASKLRPVFITVDPRRDTPAVVKQYAAAFGPSITGLTGTPEEIAAVAREYRVYYAEHRTGPGPNDYAMDHSSVLYLMNPQGKFVTVLRTDESGAEMAADLRKIIG